MDKMICADVLDWARNYSGEPFHALLTDPPYEMSFMGKDWDRSGIAFKPDTWAALAEHLHPGAFGMAFASARGWHRLAVAIEDAGLRIHPSIFGYSYGSGFPKATRIDTQVDKAAGAEREVVGRSPYASRRPNPMNGTVYGYNEGKYDISANLDITAPATDLAQSWAGHRYGLQAMKPACEPLITFTKPLRVNLFCGIMTEITFLMEVLSCILLNAQDAESLTSHLHQRLKAGVDNSVQGNVDDLELLKTVTIAGDPSASGLAGSTLADFVAGPAPMPDAMHRLVKSLGIGEAENLSARDTDTYEQTMVMMQSIVWLWSGCLDDLLTAANTFTTEMVTVLTTDLRILKLCLRQIISGVIIHQNEPSGQLSLVHSVENLLKSLVVKLPLLKTTIATESALDPLVRRDSVQAESLKAGASLNPIIVFQKPYSGKPVDCITETGAGALWIDGGRISANDFDPKSRVGAAKIMEHRPWQERQQKEGRPTITEGNPLGRWPANLTLQHHPDCVRVGEKRVRGTSGGGQAVRTSVENWRFNNHKRTGYTDPDGLETVAAWECVESCPVRCLDDNGAARFFHQSDWSYEIAERLAQADPVRYQAKASRKERTCNGTVDTRHPTVKPIALTRWLATLLLPPPEYAPRRILVPFAGVMSEGIGCMLAGWEEIVAIEMSEEYCQIGEARFNWWRSRMKETDSFDPGAILKTYDKTDKEKQDLLEHLRGESLGQIPLGL